MIQRILVYIFGVNYQTTVAGILGVIAAIPGAITMIQAMYGSQLTLPPWVTIVSVVCVFITYIYGTSMQKTKTVSGTNGGAKLNVGGEMKSAEEIKKDG